MTDLQVSLHRTAERFSDCCAGCGTIVKFQAGEWFARNDAILTNPHWKESDSGALCGNCVEDPYFTAALVVLNIPSMVERKASTSLPNDLPV